MALQNADFISEMLDAATYDDETGTLTVTMHGDDYTTQITPEQWQAFLNADSKGHWYRQNIMGKVR